MIYWTRFKMYGIVLHACLVVLGLLIHVKSTGSASYTIEKGPLAFASARSRCQTQGGDLVDFRQESSQTKARKLMIGNNVEQIWLNTKETLNPWVWVKDCTLLRNQGCYLDKSQGSEYEFKKLTQGETPDMLTYTPMNPLRRDQCITQCSSYKFATIQRGLRGAETNLQNLCGCGNSYGKYLALSLGNCPQKCTNPGSPDDAFCPEAGKDQFASVFSVGGTAYPEWSEYWHQEKSKYDNCGVFSQEANPSSSIFKMDMCHNNATPLCEVPARFEQSIQLPKSGVWVRALQHQMSNWHTARDSCRALSGGELFKADTKEKVDDLSSGAISTTPKHFWIGAIKNRWPWLNEQQPCPSRAVLWPAGLPESCLVYSNIVGGQEQRLKVSCTDTTAAFVCKIPDASDTTTTTSSSAASSSGSSTTTVKGQEISGEETTKGEVNDGARLGGYVILIVVNILLLRNAL